MTHPLRYACVAAAVLLGLVAFVLTVSADSVSVNFEDPPYTLGTINGQDGWTSTGAAGSGCATYDHAVSSSLGVSGFGSQSLRISNAVTSGCFGDHTFGKPVTNAVGETGATAGSFPAGTLQKHFEMEFDLASTVPGAQQPGLFMSVSPDRGDGSRMSYLGFSDVAGGIRINFFDVQGTTNPATFVESVLGTYDRSVKHHIKLTFDAVDGPSNDIVKVSIDGNVVHTGTSWENYYRFDSEASAEQNVRIVRSVLFRTGGAPAPLTAGNGYLVDNFSALSGASPAPSSSTIVVNPSDMATSFGDVFSNPTKWFFYNDETDVIDNSLGSFVTGPSTPPLGIGSSQISVSGTQRRNLATYQFSGTKLGDITTLKFSTYNPSAGNGGSANRSAYLNFNVDINGSDTFQRRLVFVPRNNGTVVQNSWQEWDALQNGNAMWSYSGPTWPTAPSGPHQGLVGIPGTTLRSWNDILADYPGVRVRVTDSWMGLRVGEPYADGYTENLDKFVFGTAATVKTWDFDPTPPPTTGGLVVRKNTNTFDGTFDFSEPTLGSFSITTVGNTGTESFSNLAPGTYTITESVPAGWSLTSNGCASVTVTAGATSTCTVVNSFCNALGCPPPAPNTGSLQVNKVANGGNGTFNFTGNAGSFSITTSGGSGNKIINGLAPGSYTVNETVPAGWTMNSNTCSSVTVTAGQTASCTVTNTKNPVTCVPNAMTVCP